LPSTPCKAAFGFCCALLELQLQIHPLQRSENTLSRIVLRTHNPFQTRAMARSCPSSSGRLRRARNNEVLRSCEEPLKSTDGCFVLSQLSHLSKLWLFLCWPRLAAWPSVTDAACTNSRDKCAGLSGSGWAAMAVSTPYATAQAGGFSAHSCKSRVRQGATASTKEKCVVSFQVAGASACRVACELQVFIAEVGLCKLRWIRCYAACRVEACTCVDGAW
jgi:hypothetical protein